jgi:CheY-like chemotaxis protein
MSSLEAGHLSIEPAAHDVSALIEQAVDLLMPLATDKSISLEHDLPGRLGALCDESRVLQVLSNLVGNALKFTPDGGRVVVSAEVMAQEQRVRVTVTDNGPGMPKAVMLRLFERYWQASETASKGRGLGLYIAKGIIEAQGGTIWCESQPNKGTAFSFTLPLAPLPEQQDGRKREGMVMVVDDEEDIRELIAEILEEHDYAAVKSANGEQALKYLTSDQPKPQLVLLDLTMPVMDGRALMTALKRDPMLAAIPVVLVSSAADLADQVRELGAVASLRKPIDVDTLLELVADRVNAPAPEAKA